MLKTFCFLHDAKKIMSNKDGMDVMMKGAKRTRKGFRKKEEQQHDDDALVVQVK